MRTKEELKTRAKAAHDALSAPFYAKKHSKKGVTPAEQAAFDTAHQAIWQGLDTDIRIQELEVQP